MHVQRVGDDDAVKAHSVAHDLCQDRAAQCCRRLRIDGGKDDMAGHHHISTGGECGTKGREVSLSELVG